MMSHLKAALCSVFLRYTILKTELVTHPSIFIDLILQIGTRSNELNSDGYKQNVGIRGRGGGVEIQTMLPIMINICLWLVFPIMIFKIISANLRLAR